jgi:hypothetical protein
MQAKIIKRLAIATALLSLAAGMGFFMRRHHLTSQARSRAEQAERARTNGDFERAENLYGKYLLSVLEDVDMLTNYADTLHNGVKSSAMVQSDVLTIPDLEALYAARAARDLRAGHVDKAIETLEDGMNSKAEKSGLRWLLANILAQRGDTVKLLRQIEELTKLGFAPRGLQYLAAHYYVNSHEFRKARQLVVPLESTPDLAPPFKARVTALVARCYIDEGPPRMRLLAAEARGRQSPWAKNPVSEWVR